MRLISKIELDFVNLVSDYCFKMVHKVTKGYPIFQYPIFQTEVPDPYPHLNGRQQLGTLEACPLKPLHISVTISKAQILGIQFNLVIRQG